MLLPQCWELWACWQMTGFAWVCPCMWKPARWPSSSWLPFQWFPKKGNKVLTQKTWHVQQKRQTTFKPEIFYWQNKTKQTKCRRVESVLSKSMSRVLLTTSLRSVRARSLSSLVLPALFPSFPLAFCNRLQKRLQSDSNMKKNSRKPYIWFVDDGWKSW